MWTSSQGAEPQSGAKVSISLSWEQQSEWRLDKKKAAKRCESFVGYFKAERSCTIKGGWRHGDGVRCGEDAALIRLHTSQEPRVQVVRCRFDVVVISLYNLR